MNIESPVDFLAIMALPQKFIVECAHAIKVAIWMRWNQKRRIKIAKAGTALHTRHVIASF